MVKVKRMTSLMLSGLILCTLLSACADKKVTDPSNEVTSESTAQQSAETDTTQASDSDSAAAQAVINYPVDGEITLSVWRPFESMMWGGLMSSYDDMPMLQSIETATGINLEFDSVTAQATNEAFNLMMASGDWDDLCNLSSYAGGLSKAYEDSVCYDLSDSLAEYMPDYVAALNTMKETYPNAYRQTLTDDGRTLAVYSISDNYVQEQGLVIRSDWMSEAGLKEIATIDDVNTFLSYVTKTYSPTFALTPSTGGEIDGITGAFGISGFDASGSSSDVGLFLDGDTVVSSITADGYRDYIEWFNKMFKMGGVKSDFYSQTYGPDWLNSYFSDDDVAMSFLRADKISTIMNAATSSSFALQPSASVVKNAGDSYNFGDERSVVSCNFSVMSTSKHLKECMEFLNWFYTDDGYVLSNYGQEGLTFNYDDDGTVKFTDLIVNSSFSNKIQVKNMYGGMIFPFLKDVDCFYYTYADIEQEAMDIWSQSSDKQVLPTFLLSSSASSDYQSIAPDIISYASTEVMKWLVGEAELTDESWKEYVDQCNSLGLPDVVSIYQEAYNSFLSR